MVHRKAAYRPLGMQGASGLRDTPGHTSRSLQRTNVYKVDRVKIDKKMNTGHNDFGGSSSSGCILHLCQIFKASELNNASHVSDPGHLEWTVQCKNGKELHKKFPGSPYEKWN